MNGVSSVSLREGTNTLYGTIKKLKGGTDVLALHTTKNGEYAYGVVMPLSKAEETMKNINSSEVNVLTRYISKIVNDFSTDACKIFAKMVKSLK